ncbi:hypothetical protein [Bacillus dakarensis]|uniref:hypothetical protein n=1 Tax=Robertmurraya dakarensis TaxID=1926278 RepID=UPI0009810A29|nr:hypothetical protein [Bacillus dakarensis]
MIPQNLGSETNIKLPFSFILFSIIAMILSQTLFLVNGESLINGIYRIPAIWSAAHLFILGWALMIAMGSMYQLVPVAFLTPIWSEKFGFIQFGVTAIGIVWFAGALYISPESALIPGVVMLAGILLFIVQMGMTLRKQAKPNILTIFVGSALLCLFITIAFGITLVISMNTGFAGSYYTSIFKSHILIGTAGWFTLLIFGFSYKMAPMFSLSHGYPMNLAKYVFGMYAAGLIMVVLSFFLDHSIMLTGGFLLLLIGFSLFLYHISIIVKKRIKKKLDRPFSFALLAIIFGEIIHLLAFIAAVTNTLNVFVGPLMAAYLFLWIAFSIIGYLYKIVPFLWWTHKYSQIIGKKDVPALKDMINEKLALPLFIIFILGVGIVSGGLVLGLAVLFYIGQSLILLASIIFGGAILAVMKK